jgi:hypothetical protein
MRQKQQLSLWRASQIMSAVTSKSITAGRCARMSSLCPFCKLPFYLQRRSSRTYDTLCTLRYPSCVQHPPHRPVP